MKWFFALNEKGNEFNNYAKMLKVAVYTAQKFTSLNPYFLYDGEENDLTDWLRARNVEIIRCRSFLYDELQKIADARRDQNFLAIGAGAFLRTEIPRITEELKINDKYVLYTDVDVMFLSEVEYLKNMRPKYFAVAPEYHIKSYRRMNTGVMIMNLKNLRDNDAEFRRFMSKKIKKLVNKRWDQGAYQMFYKKLFGYKWDKLPIEYNWKTYWKENSQAKIIHFHGPKPYMKEILSSPNPPEHLKPLLVFITPNYAKLSRLWNEFYEAAIGEEKVFTNFQTNL